METSECTEFSSELPCRLRRTGEISLDASSRRIGGTTALVVGMGSIGVGKIIGVATGCMRGGLRRAFSSGDIAALVLFMARWMAAGLG